MNSPHRIPFSQIVTAWIASAITLGLAFLIFRFDHVPYVLASLGGSCVILFGMPESVMAQPRSLIGGHVIGTVSGLMWHQLVGADPITMAAAVATAVSMMMVTNTLHSPAGADPLIVISAGADWRFLWQPLAIGLAVLLCGALVYHRGILKRSYPDRWF